MILNNLKKSITKKNMDEHEQIKHISILLFLMYPVISIILNRLFVYKNIGNYSSLIIVGVFALAALTILFFKNIKSMILMLLCFWGIVLLNYIFHFSTINQTIKLVIKNFLSCYLMFMIIVSCEDLEKLLEDLKKGGYFVSILIIIYILLMKNNKSILMETGLTLQLVLIVFLPINLVFTFKNRKITDFIFSTIQICEICYFSSRTIILTTWILTITLFFVYYIKLFKESKSFDKKIASLICIIILIFLIIICIINIRVIAEKLYVFLIQRGIYVRTLRLISEGEISNSSGRMETVYPTMVKKILESPLIGHGIGMDRIITTNNESLYAHNIILELFVSYGMLMGTAIIMTIIILTQNAFKSKFKSIIFGMLCSGIIILSLTSSYLLYRGFWLFLAILINIARQKEKFNFKTFNLTKKGK